jgi:hypothetical protein
LFIDRTINSKIITILTILSIGLLILPTSGNGLASTQITNQNSTNVTQTQSQQPQETQLKPFTIPKDNSDNPRESSNVGFTKSNNNNEDNIDDDIVLLSQNYDNDRFADHLVGELLNNGSETADSVQVAASFYDEDGAFLGTASGFTEPSSIPSGGRAGFDIMITSDTVQDDTETYEFSIQWRDDDFDQHTIRITGAQGESSDDDDNDSDNGNDNDNNRVGRITITTSLTQPQGDPRNDPKYDSIDWQDDDPSKNLSIEEMDKILEDKEQNGDDNDNGGNDPNRLDNDNGGDDNGGDDN